MSKLPNPDTLVEDLPDPSSLVETPTGLPSINESTGTSLPQDAQPSLGASDFSNPTSTPTAVSGSDLAKQTTAPILGAPQQGMTGIPPPMPLARDASAVYTPLLKYGGAAVGAAGAGVETGGLGAFAGGSLGYAGGAFLADQLDQLIGVSAKPKSVSEVVSRATGNLAEGELMAGANAALEAPIGAAMKFLGTGASALAVHGPAKIKAISDAASGLGINLTPAEILGSKALGAVESVLDNVPWTSGIIQKYRLGEMQKLNVIRQNLIEEGGSSDTIEQMGLKIKGLADDFMQKTISTNKVASIAMKNRLLDKVGSRESYEDLDIGAKELVQRYQQELAGKVSQAYNGIAGRVGDLSGVPENTIAMANKILQDQEEISPGSRNVPLIKMAKFFTQSQSDIPPDVLNLYMRPNINPSAKAALEDEYPGLLSSGQEKQYQRLKSNLTIANQNKYSNINTVNGKYQISPEGRDWGLMADSIKSDMGQLINNSGDTNLQEAQKVADLLFQKKMALFEDPAFKAINNKSPGAIAQTILKSGDTEMIEKYKAITGPELFNRTKDRLTNDILGLRDGDIVNGDSIRANVLKLGQGATKIYSPEELTYFKSLANAVDLREGATNELLKNPLLKQTLKADIVPEKVAQAILVPQKPGAAVAIDNMLGRGSRKKIADAALPALLSTGQNGDFAPQTFAKQFDTYGKETLEAWYGKDFTAKLQQLRDASSIMGGAERMAGNPSGTGRFLIGFYEGKRILGDTANALAAATVGAGLATGHAVLSLGTDAAMILGSRQLAKLYISDAGKKLFVDGLMTPSVARGASALAARIISMVGMQAAQEQE